MITYPLGVGGTTTRVLEAGTGDRHVVFLHGVGARGDRWRRNLDELATTGWHCVAFDLPGHGFADKTAEFDYSVPGFARFLGELLAVMEIEQTALVGTSLGGNVAARYAVEGAGSITSLVLVGSLGLAPMGGDARSWVATSIRDTSREGIERKLKGVVLDPTLVSEGWIEEEWRINNSPGAADAFESLSHYFLNDIDDDVVLGRLEEMTGVPLLLVWGSDDAIVPLNVGENAASCLPGSRLEVLSARHLPYYERADDFNALLAAFLHATGA